ncbi:MAG: DUF4332 domain-containing protein [Pirellulales bacterium]
MRVVHLDMDRRGNGTHFHLGPFAEGLNVVCGPRASGKSSILKLARELLAKGGRGELMPRRSSEGGGTIQVADEVVHYRLSTVEPDHQRVRVEFRPALPRTERWLDEYRYRNPKWNRISTKHLETIHFGAHSPTIASLLHAAKELGLCKDRESTRVHAYDALKREETDLLRRLRHASFLNHDRSWWDAEYARVQQRLRSDVSHEAPQFGAESVRLEDRIRSLQNEIERIRRTEEEISLSLQEKKRSHGFREGQPSFHPENAIAYTRRKQLEEIDSRLYNWRQTLREVREHRDRIQREADDLRLRKQFDQGDRRDARATLDSLESQLLNTRRHLEEVIANNDENRHGDRFQFQQSLPATLRSIQDDLSEVTLHLNRAETNVAAEKHTSQIEQLKRCENELNESLERLISERGLLLKQISQEYNIPLEKLSLALGDWSQCHEHPHLYQWLLSDYATDSLSADHLLHTSALYREIDQLQAELIRERQRLENALRECHDAEIQLKEYRNRHEKISFNTLTIVERDELQRRLKRAEEALAMWDQHRNWTRRLEEIQQLLKDYAVQRNEWDRALLDAANRLYREMTGSGCRRFEEEAGASPSDRPWQHVSGPTSTEWKLDRPDETHRSFLAEDWATVFAPEQTTDNHLAILCLRLAIAEALVPHVGKLPLFVDDALEGIHGSTLDRTIETLMRLGRHGQQLVLFTSDEEVASRARAHHAWVCHLSGRAYVQPIPSSAVQTRMVDWDVNQALHSYANEDDGELVWATRRPNARAIEASDSGMYRQGKQYFLSERSWVEDIPSVDRDLAAALRSVGIQDVASLLHASPAEIVSRLKVPRLTERMVRVWQAESQLMCGVPQLRGFDAQLLVSCGITSPRMLREMHPGVLLQRVEAFLSTDAGQNLLRSGSSFELSRITSWLVSAKRKWSDESNRIPSSHYDSTENPFEAGLPLQARRTDMERSQINEGVRNAERRRDEIESRRTARSKVDRQANRERRQRARLEKSPSVNTGVVRLADTGRDELDPTLDAGWKFFLDRSSPIVDAPTIGPQLAEKLKEVGITTVSQLLNATADSLANMLKIKKVDAATVQSWQKQAEMVCRIPNLRGHDAQLLVAAGISSPEKLRAMGPDEILSRVTRIASSKIGQRILRGGKAPDQSEVSDWIAWSRKSRSIAAA